MRLDGTASHRSGRGHESRAVSLLPVQGNLNRRLRHLSFRLQARESKVHRETTNCGLACEHPIHQCELPNPFFQEPFGNVAAAPTERDRRCQGDCAQGQAKREVDDGCRGQATTT